MPQGVYRKKSKRGNWMYFRNGKIISKSSYDMSKSRSKKRNGNSKPRKANNKKRSNGRMKKGIPHPSVTGMASGLAIASYLNQGKTVTGSFGKTSVVEGVLKDVAFVPVYTTRAETTSSIISVALGDGDLQFAVEPRTLKDNLRDDGPDPTQIVWTITPMDIFAPIVTAQGDRVRLDLTTTSSIVASLGGVHTSAFKKVAVQAICVRCNVPYNVGEEGNYDCQWGIQAKMIYRDYPYNATITYRGRHNHATRYPDKLVHLAWAQPLPPLQCAHGINRRLPFLYILNEPEHRSHPRCHAETDQR